jgi:hypothetical protein
VGANEVEGAPKEVRKNWRVGNGLSETFFGLGSVSLLMINGIRGYLLLHKNNITIARFKSFRYNTIVHY